MGRVGIRTRARVLLHLLLILEGESMYYTITWNNGRVDRYPANEYKLEELKDLEKMVRTITQGKTTGIIETKEENK